MKLKFYYSIPFIAGTLLAWGGFIESILKAIENLLPIVYAYFIAFSVYFIYLATACFFNDIK